MDVLYGKRFSKDLDAIRDEKKVKKNLLELINNIKEADSLKTLGGLKKIEGYSDYFRMKVGDFRLGLKASQNKVELIRFLHRKDIYRRFP